MIRLISCIGYVIKSHHLLGLTQILSQVCEGIRQVQEELNAVDQRRKEAESEQNQEENG